MFQWLKNVFEYFGKALNGFRKWSIMILLVALGTTFLISGHLTGQEFVDLLQGTVIAFFAGNGLEHMTKAASAWLEEKNGTKV